jgi:hypothetical protein
LDRQVSAWTTRMGRIGLDSRLDKCPHVVVALFPTGSNAGVIRGNVEVIWKQYGSNMRVKRN